MNTWTCWRCTHPLCCRLAQSWEIDHARLLLSHEGDGPGRENLYRRLQMAALEVTQRESDPPKCVGTRLAGGGYFSHRAEPMEIVEVAVVGSGYVLDQETDQGGTRNGQDAGAGSDRGHHDRVGPD